MGAFKPHVLRSVAIPSHCSFSRLLQSFGLVGRFPLASAKVRKSFSDSGESPPGLSLRLNSEVSPEIVTNARTGSSLSAMPVSGFTCPSNFLAASTVFFFKIGSKAAAGPPPGGSIRRAGDAVPSAIPTHRLELKSHVNAAFLQKRDQMIKLLERDGVELRGVVAAVVEQALARAQGHVQISQANQVHPRPRQSVRKFQRPLRRRERGRGQECDPEESRRSELPN